MCSLPYDLYGACGIHFQAYDKHAARHRQAVHAINPGKEMVF